MSSHDSLKNLQERRDAILARLMRHAARHSPYYRDQDWAERLRNGLSVRFADLPITRKSALKQNAEAFYSDDVPASEGQIIDKSTSGSTGEPSPIKKTALHFRINAAENARLRKGWGFESQTGHIHASSPTRDHPPRSIENRGKNGFSDNWTIYTLEPKPVVDLLCRTKCSHIRTYPSQAVSILEITPPLDFLKLVSTVGETVPPELPSLIARFPGCLHYDTYGSVETGIIAGKCRECGQYHLATGHLVVEVLDERGCQVPPGTMGRVIVTPLFNLAMPLLRYELGDLAVPASDIPCSVSRYGLTRIVGREDNLFVLPDGSRITPEIVADDALVLGIRKFKMVQVTLEEIEFLYVPVSPDIVVGAADIQPLIDRNISPLIRVRPIRVDDIKPSPAGKYLRHESRVVAPR
ncbi:MAG: hypothetical protein ACLQUZ_05000 [Rhizomicrobium sp.]